MNKADQYIADGSWARSLRPGIILKAQPHSVSYSFQHLLPPPAHGMAEPHLLWLLGGLLRWAGECPLFWTMTAIIGLPSLFYSLL